MAHFADHLANSYIPNTVIIDATASEALTTAMSLCRQAEPVDMARFADHLASSYIPNTVIIDVTAMSFCRQAEPVDMARFADHLANSYIPNTVIIDATASEALTTAMSLCKQAEPVDMARFADHLANSYIPNTVIIDATASEAPPALYLQWMQKGIHIITPNKKLGSGPLDQYLALRHFQRESYIHFFYEVSMLLFSIPRCLV